MKCSHDKETRRWFDDFSQQEYPHVKAFVLHIFRGTSLPIGDVGDIVQSVFLTALENAKELREHPSQRAWLFKTARLKFYEYLRAREKRGCECPLNLLADVEDTCRIDDVVVWRDLLERATECLNRKDYELYRCVYQLDMSPAQIGKREGVRTDTVARRISRLNEKLRKLIKKMSENEPIRHNISERSSKS